MAMQINIAKQVISLGSARAGFYTPRFEDRAMRLRMFCLGRHWDTQTHSYSDVRSDCDGRPVLAMPSNLKELVEGILSDLKQKCQPMAHKAHFPPMEPDTCIVNWYSTSGSLGVHRAEHCRRNSSDLNILGIFGALSLPSGPSGHPKGFRWL